MNLSHSYTHLQSLVRCALLAGVFTLCKSMVLQAMQLHFVMSCQLDWKFHQRFVTGLELKTLFHQISGLLIQVTSSFIYILCYPGYWDAEFNHRIICRAWVCFFRQELTDIKTCVNNYIRFFNSQPLRLKGYCRHLRLSVCMCVCLSPLSLLTH